MKSILTTLSFMLTFSLFGQFSGYYAPANWTVANDGCASGNVNTDGAPATVTVTGAEVGGCGGSIITYSIAVQYCGTVTFNWDYTTLDCQGPYWDPYGYGVNGFFFQLSDSGGANNQSGSASITVNAGDVFSFYVYSVDSYCGEAWSTISNFSAPDAVCYGDDGTPKVLVCHKGHTICIAPAAVPAHLAHGDQEGSCEQNEGCGEGLQNSDDSRNAGDIGQAEINTIASATKQLFESISQSSTHDRVVANQIYPNPAKDNVSIKLDRMEGLTTITVYDLRGQLIQTSQVNVVRGLPFQYSVSNLAEGTYSVRFEPASGATLTQKMVVIHSGN